MDGDFFILGSDYIIYINKHMKHKIYLIVNDINNKVYIGYTSKSLSWRLGKHFEETKNNTSPTRKLHKAIKEFGKEHFSIQLLYESNDKNKTLGQKEDEFIIKYDSIKSGYNSRRGGGGVHITEGQCKKVDIYDKDGNFIKTFPSRVAVAEFIGCHPGQVTCAIRNADNGKGSQVHGYWACHHRCVPHYKTSDKTGAATKAARRANLGKKRPEHSTFMKTHMKGKHRNYHTPTGTFTLIEGARVWGRDMLIAWCNNPEQKITKMMVVKSKKLNLNDHQPWIGKTKREVGFWRE